MIDLQVIPVATDDGHLPPCLVGEQRTPRHQLLLDGFLEQVELRGDAPAASDRSCSLSYRALALRVELAARRLAQQNVGAGQVVAVAAERNVDLLVAMLAIFRAGAVYLPLDVRAPGARNATVISTANAALVLIDDKGRAALPPDSVARLLPLEALAHGADASSASPRSVGPDDLAYVIFTSGSTGAPKGAQVEHRGMLNHLTAKQVALDLGPSDVLAQTAPLCFDISIWQFLAPLSVGGQVVILDDDVVHDPDVLFEQVAALGITVLEVVPSLLKTAISAGSLRAHPATASRLRWLMLTGEALPPSLCRAWLDRYPDVPIINAYGPTECSDDVTHAFIRVPPAADATQVPIGTAICNTELYVLEQTERGYVPCKVGVVGELWIAGPCVGRGYLHDDARTREVFLTLPVHDGAPRRIYRSGDLVSLQPDGALYFHGRIDRQVKIRGNRIELGEIESQLLAQAGVTDALVVAQAPQRHRAYGLTKEGGARGGDDDQARRLLVAYVVGAELKPQELRASLEACLPPYMVPDHVYALEAMPLTANGKIDVAALPKPAHGARANLATYVPPETRAEATIAEIWEDLLGVRPIGRDDSFVALGGDSLLGMQALNRIRRALQVPLNFRQFLAGSTLAGLAQIVAAQTETVIQTAQDVSQEPRSPHPPATHSQRGLWFLWKLAPDNPYYTFQGALTIVGSLDAGRLDSACRLIRDEHAILRTHFEEHQGQIFQVASSSEPAPLAVHDLSTLAEPAREKFIYDAARKSTLTPFALDRGPLFRLELFRVSATEHVLLVTTHESIMDAWSTAVFIRLLDEAYARCSRGECTPEVGIRPQFSEFARWEAASFSRERMAVARDYWTQQLAGELPVLALPSDRPRPRRPSYRGASVETTLDPELRRQIERTCNERGCTLFSFLLTAYFVTLSRFCDQKDLIIGAPFANRQDERAEEMLGYFLNMLPFRLQLGGAESAGELLRTVSELVTSGLSHADYPFMWMVEDTRCERDLRHTPVFQVMFDMLNIPPIENGASDLKMTFQELERGFYKYDLNLYAYRSDGGIFLRLAYSSALFDETTVDQIFAGLCATISWLVGDPARRLPSLGWSELPRSSLAGETHSNVLLPLEALERAASLTPEAIALVAGEYQLSFRDVRTLAQRCAATLRARGVRQGDVIGLRLAPSPWAVAYAWGARLLGASYLGMAADETPAQALDLLKAAGARWVVSDNDEQDALPGVTSWCASELRDGSFEPVPERPGDCFCVVPTSGSSGTHKLVRLTAAGVANRVAWGVRHWALSEADRCFWLRPLNVVMHVWEAWGPLSAGVACVIANVDDLYDPRRLLELARHHRVTVLTATPSILELILKDARGLRSPWPTLRAVGTGGEPLTVDLARSWRSTFPNASLFNTYGATECTASVAFYDASRLPAGSDSVPVGRPIDNVKLHVHDEYGEPVPVGVVGELVVEGPCVADGYASAEAPSGRFFASQDGAACFGTGDLARLRRDGELEVLGRRDHQVKLRGLRVQLDDVERAVRSHPGVRDCAVVATGEGLDRELVAYVVSDDDTEHSLGNYLFERLARQMLPARYVRLAALPRTNGGKVDPKRLPQPTLGSGSGRKQVVPPRTASEQALAKLWCELLKLDEVGVDDNFFALGGSSLKALELVRLLGDRLGVELKVRDFYEGRATLGRLATMLDQGQHQPEEAAP